MRRRRRKPFVDRPFRRHATETLVERYREAHGRLIAQLRPEASSPPTGGWRQARQARAVRLDEAAYRDRLYRELTARGVDVRAIEDEVERSTQEASQP